MPQPRATPEVLSAAVDRTDAPVALRAENLSKTFYVGGESLRAVHDVSLELALGETLGLVGESGSGKTTLAKLLLGLLSPDAGGSIELDGAALPARVTNRNDEQVKSLQIVFQNPDSALNRRHTVRHLISRPLSRLAGRLEGSETALVVDAETAGRLLGVTSRTARRLLRGLVDEGLAWPLPPSRAAQPGRPRQFYRLITEKLEELEPSRAPS